MPPPKPMGLPHGGIAEEQMRCKFVIAPDCPLGEHPFKLRTATELTLLSTFWVTPFPVVMEAEQGQGGNDTLANGPAGANELDRARPHSGPIAVPTSTCSAFPASGASICRLKSTRVWLTEKFYGDSEFDLMVRLLDDAGRELARNDDSALHLQDPIVSIVLPKDGDYFVEVRQRIYKARIERLLSGADRNESPAVGSVSARRAGRTAAVGQVAWRSGWRVSADHRAAGDNGRFRLLRRRPVAAPDAGLRISQCAGSPRR